MQAPWEETGFVNSEYMPMKEGNLPTGRWVYFQVGESSHFKVTRRAKFHIKVEKDMQQGLCVRGLG